MGGTFYGPAHFCVPSMFDSQEVKVLFTLMEVK
jgi:hypothetical protein